MHACTNALLSWTQGLLKELSWEGFSLDCAQQGDWLIGGEEEGWRLGGFVGMANPQPTASAVPCWKAGNLVCVSHCRFLQRLVQGGCWVGPL